MGGQSANAGKPANAEAPAARCLLSYASMIALCVVLAPGFSPSPAQAQTQRTVPMTDKAAQLQQQRERWDVLPESDRQAIQDSLVWLGLYNGVVDGAFGQRTADAISAFEKRDLMQPGSVISGPGLSVLRAAANKQKSALGFTLMDDPATGARIGAPTRLLDRKETAPGRTRLSSSRTQTSLTLFAGGADDGDLPTWFARATDNTTPGRKVTYKLLRPDFAVVTGDEGPRRFFTRVASGPDGLRGFTFVYPVADAAAMDRVTIAIANSFAPFAGKPGAVAQPGMQQPAQPQGQRPAATAPAAATSPLVGTALLLAPGRALTATAAVRGCRDIRIGDATATVTASDRQSGLSLLSAPSVNPSVNPGAAAPIALSGEAKAETVTLAAFVNGGASQTAPAKPQLSAIPGSAFEAGKITAALQPGGAGALALDQHGALAGIVSALTPAPAINGVSLAATQIVADGASIRRILTEAGVTLAANAATAPESTGAITAQWRPRLAAVICADQPASLAAPASQATPQAPSPGAPRNAR